MVPTCGKQEMVKTVSNKLDNFHGCSTVHNTAGCLTIVSHLLHPFDLHVVSIHNGRGVHVKHGTSLSNGHGLIVLDSKHMVEVRDWGQVTGRPAVVTGDALCQLTVLG